MAFGLLIAGLSQPFSLADESIPAERAVTETQTSEFPGGSQHVSTGTIPLAADGIWSVREPEGSHEIKELYLVPSEESGMRSLGKRMYAALEKRHIERGRRQVQRGFEACRKHAQDHGGCGPKSINDLTDDNRWSYVKKYWESGYWGHDEIVQLVGKEPPTGPFVHLVPNATFDFDQTPPEEATSRKRVLKANRTVLAFQLRPLIDDGKHWVLFTDGNCEREDIDHEMVSAQKVNVLPVLNSAELEAQSKRPTRQYTIVMVTQEPFDQDIKLTAFNQVLGESTDIHWNVKNPKRVSYDTVKEQIDTSRSFTWRPYLAAGAGGVLNAWESSGGSIDARINRGRSSSAFAVLGGRAAIEETVQLQNLTVAQSNTTEKAEELVDIDSLDGVKVVSHPFEEMLGDNPGGSLELANYAPADHFFVYVGKPESIPALLDSGAPFVASIGTTMTGNSLQYSLESRYLAKLGMTRDWVDAVFTSGMVRDMVIFTPDLFFIDGTDVTVVAQLRQPQLLNQLLGVLGVSGLETESVLQLPTVSGKPAYIALRDDLLFVSTHRQELQQALDLHETQGTGSLGQSTEFRYMLTQLDVTENTRLYAYLSDPFVRRLVGPRTKIGQRRRVLAKAKMEALTAKAMLSRLNGQPNTSLQQPNGSSTSNRDGILTDKLLIQESGIVRSERYGALPNMETLPEIPLQKVTKEEAEAYRRYMDNYSRYWRRFFDPIAVRLNDAGPGELELSTFILPLVDNSIYNTLRMSLAHQDDQTPLPLPVVEPAPVLQFSANLKEDAWRQIAGNFSTFFTRYSGASPAMLDDFGPSVHVAIFDADPIIAMGSGDLFGAFGGNMMTGGNQMMMLPVALSMLTRPCSIMVETKAPQQTAQYLRQAALAGVLGNSRSRGFTTSFYQVEDQDKWVWTMDLFGVLKLRYGIEVVDQYMVIRNIPWSSDDRVVRTENAELNAALLRIEPSACKQQLPGLFAAASDAQRRSVMSGMGRLYPFMLAGAKNVQEAASQHQKLFGFYPRVPSGDKWEWKHFRLVSEQFGEPTRQRQPAFNPEKPFGMLNRIETMQLNMQFESDGLRSSVRWKLR